MTTSPIRRLVRRHRRVLAALAAGASIVSLGAALQPAGAGTRAAVVASSGLPTGHHLTADDLAVVPVPSGVIPEGAWSAAEELVGQVLAAPVSRGEVIVPGRILGAPLPVEAAGPPGLRPLPTRFADAGATALLAPGHRIDVLASGGTDGLTGHAPAMVVAEDVLVLSVAQDPEGSGLLTGAAPTAGPLVLLAADAEQARAIAGAQASARLSFVFRPP